jgi:hypothetical protein
MTNWHAVMLGEDGGEFGVTFLAAGRTVAYEYLEERYPESTCRQLENSADTAAREQDTYDWIAREMDGDDHDDEYDEEDYDEEEDLY